MKIPSRNADLRRYVRRNDFRRLALWLIWITLWALGAVFYNRNHQTYPPERLMLGWNLVLWLAAAALSGFFLFRIGRFITDRPLTGTVIDTGLSRTYTASSDPGTRNASDYDFRLNTALKLRDADGRVHRLRFEQKKGFYRYYREGSALVRLHGLPYPINLDPSEGYICAACGKISDELSLPCEFCGFSLIDPAGLRDDSGNSKHL